MRKLILTLSLVMAANAKAETVVDTNNTKIDCQKVQLFTSQQSNNAAALKCNIVETWEYGYGANFFELISDANQFASQQMLDLCEKKSMHHGRYIEGVTKGGVENYKLETEETDIGVKATISATFYCVANKSSFYTL